MKTLFRVVGGLDLSAERDAKKSLEEARKRARPVLKRWLQQVKDCTVKRSIKPIDYMMAEHLTDYPSANEGRCYAGQKRLGAKIGCCDRTARRSLRRLCDAGLLDSKRGGPGRTASWRFCVDGKPIFGGAERIVAAQDRTDVADLDRTDVSDKPSEPNPIEHNPPPTPKPDAECEEMAEGPAEEPSEQAIEGELIAATISFQEFWLAAGKRGKEGFARSEWRKLTEGDKAAISERLSRVGSLPVGDCWAGTWLRDRVWEEFTQHRAEQPWRASHKTVYAPPGSNLWHAERARLVAAEQTREVKLMDDFAWEGKGITVKVPNTS